MSFRIEKDTIGEIQVESTKYGGAQTERSRNNFKIGPPASMPLEIVHAFAVLKKAAASTNFQLGVLEENKKDLIAKVCDEILDNQLNNEFPLVVWQTGSGTQSNMNVNEVIANRAHVLNGGSLDEENTTFPVLPLRDIVVFPHMIVPLFVGREKSVKALEEVMKDNKQILLSSQIDPSEDQPTDDSIFKTSAKR